MPASIPRCCSVRLAAPWLPPRRDPRTSRRGTRPASQGKRCGRRLSHRTLPLARRGPVRRAGSRSTIAAAGLPSLAALTEWALLLHQQVGDEAGHVVVQVPGALLRRALLRHCLSLCVCACAAAGLDALCFTLSVRQADAEGCVCSRLRPHRTSPPSRRRLRAGRRRPEDLCLELLPCAHAASGPPGFQREQQHRQWRQQQRSAHDTHGHAKGPLAAGGTILLAARCVREQHGSRRAHVFKVKRPPGVSHVSAELPGPLMRQLVQSHLSAGDCLTLLRASAQLARAVVQHRTQPHSHPQQRALT